MQKKAKIFLFTLLAVVVVLASFSASARESIVLTDTSPDTTVSSGETVTIFGSAGDNHVTVATGANVKIVNFPGSNTITIASNSDSFTVSRTGAVVILEGTGGTLVKLPATTSSQIITFDNGSLILKIESGQVMLGSNSVNAVPAGIEGAGIILSGKVYDDIVPQAVVTVSGLGHSDSLGSAVADNNGEWFISLSPEAAASHDLLLLTAVNPQNGLEIHSIINSADIPENGRFSSDATIISHYTEAAWQIADARNITSPAQYLANIIEISAWGEPVSTSNEEINTLAEWISSYYENPDATDLNQYRVELLSKTIEVLWPFFFIANSVTNIGLPGNLLDNGLDIAVSHVTTEDSVVKTENGISVTIGAPTGDGNGEVTIEIAGDGQAQTVLILSFYVMQPLNSAEATLSSSGGTFLELDELEVQAGELTFNEPTKVIAYKISTDEISSMVAGTPLAAFDLQAESQLDGPVTFNYTVGEDQDPENIFLVHVISATGKTENIYPDSYDANTRKLTFSVVSFSPYGFLEKSKKYNLGTTFTLDKLIDDSKESFDFIEHLIEALGDDDNIKELNSDDEGGEYAAILVSEALYSFLELVRTGNIAEELKNHTYGFFCFKKNAAKVYNELVTKLNMALVKINNKAGISKFSTIYTNGDPPIFEFLNGGAYWASDLNMGKVQSIAADRTGWYCYYAALSYHLLESFYSDFDNISSKIQKDMDQGKSKNDILEMLKETRANWLLSVPRFIDSKEELSILETYVMAEAVALAAHAFESARMQMEIAALMPSGAVLAGQAANELGLLVDGLAVLYGSLVSASYSTVVIPELENNKDIWTHITLSTSDGTKKSVGIYTLKAFNERLTDLDKYIKMFSSPSIWYRDNDNDGYGDEKHTITAVLKPDGYVSNDDDCDDTDASVHQNCDPPLETTTYYPDIDRDGYGDEDHPYEATSQPAGYVLDHTDCDDTDASIHPGATEIAGDGIDQNCDGIDHTHQAKNIRLCFYYKYKIKHLNNKN
ncbi:exported hypothetical protein [Desulfamplus magnetovallimortis]|uniref:Uncharacterized protein n=1 Tax=Desulfamplus magnetovallimortis TaxID=1246637 RepID=A0A1W1HDJ2_9BACT|nr:putative metal-binding motif-containing protein [Desulfamplus magnetovallimortis]SLM30506.1 exported hypothetical protein [Desulfamplus magnetovallimortis]